MDPQEGSMSFAPQPFQLTASPEDDQNKIAPGVDQKLSEIVDQMEDDKAPIGNEPAIQRQISKLTVNKDSGKITNITTDTKRPIGEVNGKQGDHSTPFATLQHQVVNAMIDCTISEAFDNLSATYNVYKTLPGWATTKQDVKKRQAAFLESSLSGSKTKGNLLTAAQLLLQIRNQISLTAYKTGSKKGTAHDEGGLCGGLHFTEMKVRRKGSHVVTKGGVMHNVYHAFEHGRFNNMKSEARKKAIIRQHAITMHDAYPFTMSFVKMTVEDIIKYFYSKKKIKG